MYRGQSVETQTWVDLSENVHVTHGFEGVDDEVTLTFRGGGDLVLNCTPKAFASLAEAVRAADVELEARLS
ncbi:hypothetical protein [Haloactinomyces albus]|uniref:Uncharacterized protein n=1 Tax=Haloactinomyces albus TaxID=1352928 RepID=A0AAE3ZB55_9ACTN|nr:hypothetical protein [Haloactinomyces albus]MDR7301671.1 hypothetical protein [Haloactinomyces albus]